MKIVGITQSVFLSCKQRADKMLLWKIFFLLYEDETWNFSLKVFRNSQCWNIFLSDSATAAASALKAIMPLYEYPQNPITCTHHFVQYAPPSPPPTHFRWFFMVFRIWFMISLHDEKCYDYESLWWTMYYKNKLKLRAFSSFLFSFHFYIPRFMYHFKTKTLNSQKFIVNSCEIYIENSIKLNRLKYKIMFFRKTNIKDQSWNPPTKYLQCLRRCKSFTAQFYLSYSWNAWFDYDHKTKTKNEKFLFLMLQIWIYTIFVVICFDYIFDIPWIYGILINAFKSIYASVVYHFSICKIHQQSFCLNSFLLVKNYTNKRFMNVSFK